MLIMAMNAAFGVACAQGTWSTAQLSVARGFVAAASVGNVALFAGGYTSQSALLSGVGGVIVVSLCALSVCNPYNLSPPVRAHVLCVPRRAR